MKAVHAARGATPGPVGSRPRAGADALDLRLARLDRTMEALVRELADLRRATAVTRRLHDEGRTIAEAVRLSPESGCHDRVALGLERFATAVHDYRVEISRLADEDTLHLDAPSRCGRTVGSRVEQEGGDDDRHH